MTRRQWPVRRDGATRITHAALREAERDAIAAGAHYAERHGLGSPGDEVYLRAVESARLAVAFRLLGGLARETPDTVPAPFTVESSLPDGPGDLLASLEMTDLRRRLPGVDAPDRLLLAPFPAADRVVVAPVRARRGFDRFRFGDWLVECGPERTRPVGSPERLVTALQCEGFFETAAAAERARELVGDGVATLALASLARSVLWEAFEGTPRPTDTADCPAADVTALFDRLAVGGHPLHPGAKTRRSLSATDSLAFAPEFTGSIPVRFVAVRGDRVRSESVDDRSLTDRLYHQFSGLRAATDDAVPGGVDEYAVVPVHPWQLRTVIYDRYADARRRGVVVPVPEYARPATPLLSLRTVAPRPDRARVPHPTHLKLAMNVLTTSSVRTLSPQAALTGPRASRLLVSLCERESFSAFGVLRALASACYHPSGGPHVEGAGYDDVRNLSALARQHPATHPLVDDGAAAVTAASLLSRPPADESPVLSTLLDAYAAHSDCSTRRETVTAFLRAYLEAVVPGPLTLLVKHGVGLEAHLQNTYVVFDDGRPTASLLSDFGAVRVHGPRLTGATLDPYPGSDVVTEDETVVRGELWNTLVQHHLGELIGRLTATEPIDAADCWSLVRRCCERVFDRLEADSAVPTERVAADRASLFASRMQHMSLTETWLRDRESYDRTTVPNPLATAGDP